MNTVKLDAAVCADKGKVRQNNEDNFYFNGIHLDETNRDDGMSAELTPEGSFHLFGVFDGMGGEELGEEASLIAAKCSKAFHDEKKESENVDTDRVVGHIIKKANKKICDKILETGAGIIGTTLSVMTVKDDTAKIYNVGDSRVYMLRNKKLTQLSVDDTASQRLINMGVITAEEAKTHPDRHKLTQHLGIFQEEMTVKENVSKEIYIQKGDKFLICSDGLTDMVENDVIESILKKNEAPSQLARELVDKALENGGIDNVTVMVVCAKSNSKIKRPSSGSPSKKIIAGIVAALVLIAGAYFLFAPKEDSAPPIYWSTEAEQYPVGKALTLSVEKSKDAPDGEITYTSSDPSVFQIVDEKKGLAVALAEGTVTVTAQMGDVKAEKTITVVAAAPADDTATNQEQASENQNSEEAKPEGGEDSQGDKGE
ncbi:MAG: protein phosphatase 2C domain-containing protein [Clostridia bacterium]|nr:protein phosphatase 2C domain-containing protein [Clostridia bacterium]